MVIPLQISKFIFSPVIESYISYCTKVEVKSLLLMSTFNIFNGLCIDSFKISKHLPKSMVDISLISSFIFSSNDNN